MLASLFIAAECGDAKKVEELITKIPRNYVNETDYRERTALHLAVERGHLEVVDALLSYEGLKLDATDSGGFTALHLAAELGHDTIMTRLLEKLPRSVERRTHKGGLTCLHLAAIRGHATIVKQLLTTNLKLIDIVALREKSALEFAVEYGQEEIVAMLVDSVIQSKNMNHAKTMFHHAIRTGADHVASQLLTQIPELMNLAHLGNDVVVYVRLYGDFDYSDVPDPIDLELRGKNVLHLAAEYGRDMIVSQLLAEKPDLLDVSEDVKIADVSPTDGLIDDDDDDDDDPNLVKSHSRRSVLHLAVKNGHGKVVAQLLAAKPAIATQIDSERRTALHLAVVHCNEVVPLLLAHCPDLIDAEDGCGHTSLHLAVDLDHVRGAERSDMRLKTVACLLARKPARVDGRMLWSALTRAEDVSGDEIVKLLVQYKPELIESLDPNHLYSSSRTVLHRVLGPRTNLQDLFSEELMLLVWQMFPEALHKLDNGNETPFHAAIRSDNKFAMELVQAKLALDEIMEAFVKCDEECPQSISNQFRECLSESLNKDLVELIIGYLTPPPPPPPPPRERVDPFNLFLDYRYESDSD